MILLNRAQRVSLKRVWDRGQNSDRKGQAYQGTYREFRLTVQPGSNCIMVPWCGMWLGIEPDGYTHS